MQMIIVLLDFILDLIQKRKSLINEVKGIGINPTGLPFTDMICLSRSVLGDKKNNDKFLKI